MKAFWLLLAGGALLLSPALVAGGQGKLPPAEAAALWRYITQTSPYTAWGSWPDYQGVQRARSPHGPFNRVYVNQICLDSSKPPVAYGSMEVKAVQTKQGKLKGVVAMYKVKGFDPKAGDWFWAVYSPGGKVRAAGKLHHCIRCHSAMADNDYIMVHNFH